MRIVQDAGKYRDRSGIGKQKKMIHKKWEDAAQTIKQIEMEIRGNSRSRLGEIMFSVLNNLRFLHYVNNIFHTLPALKFTPSEREYLQIKIFHFSSEF